MLLNAECAKINALCCGMSLSWKIRIPCDVIVLHFAYNSGVTLYVKYSWNFCPVVWNEFILKDTHPMRRHCTPFYIQFRGHSLSHPPPLTPIITGRRGCWRRWRGRQIRRWAAHSTSWSRYRDMWAPGAPCYSLVLRAVSTASSLES